MEMDNPDHPFWRGCRRLLDWLQQPPQTTLQAPATAAATALAQAVAGGRQEAASEALATLLLEGGDELSRAVEREFRPGAFSFLLTGWSDGRTDGSSQGGDRDALAHTTSSIDGLTALHLCNPFTHT